jgi:hypothetical protein
MFDAAMGSFADVGVEIAINKEGRVGPHVGEPICDMDVWPLPVISV